MPTPRIVAEISANHDNSLDTAIDLIDAAHWAGADAVKFQTWTADTMAIGNEIMHTGPWAGQSLKDLYRKAYLPWDWQVELFTHARKIGIVPFASVFDRPALEFLESLQCPMYKIASCEIVDLPLLRAVARTGKPMIISTGMATRGEIEEALHTVRSVKDSALVTLLKCTAAYPASPDKTNLATMAHMAREYRCETGLSDHTTGIGVPILAAGSGAKMIEKHIRTASSNGLDAAFSLSPAMFKEMVDGCRDAVNAWGDVKYGTDESEKPVRALRRSLHWAMDLPKNTKIKPEHIVSSRPANGMHPRYMKSLTDDRTLAEDVKMGDPALSWQLEA